MKKIILGFFMLLIPFLSHAQLPTNEGFESATFPPTAPGNWITMDNGVGTAISWAETTDPTRVYAGLKAAIMDRENVGAGNTSIDWLVTPQLTVTANNQLRFFTRQTLVGNNGATYEIRVSTNASQTNQTAYTTIQSWTETTLNATYNIYEEKTVSLAAYPAGTQLYIAFVKLNTQPTTATTGDRWLVDDVKVVQQCLDPTILSVGTITPTSAVLTWTSNGTPLNYDVEVVQGFTTPFTNIATQVGVANNTSYTGLTPGTEYKYQVRANCGLGNYSAWVGPFIFYTTPYGSICSSPLTITSLPFSDTSNTNLYGDEVDVIQGVGLCGAVPTTTNYQAGAEVFYSYTPTVSGNITITMNPTGVSSSLFVYNGCGTYPGTCIAGVANTAATPRTVTSLAVVAGQTYIIVISSSTTPAAGIPYTLIVQEVNCTTPVGQPVTSITTTGANLSWTNPSAATSWQVAIQPAGSAIPTGAGVTATTNTNWATPTLTAATAYQYWVRADCGGGLFSAWAGPYLFNTETCIASEKCNYVFRLTDSFGDGWNGALMEVRQNGVVVATLGATFTTGAGPINITVPLCQTLPLELYWTNGGSFASEVGVSVINNTPFNQILFTKAAGTGTPSTTVPIFTTSFNCSQPACLPPTALTVTAITTAGATLGWAAGGASAWDIYIVPTGSPAPTVTTVPTFTNIATNPFVVTTLLPNTVYQYYIRTVCNPTTNSVWTPVGTFTTLPTCSKPTLPTVTSITQFTAVLGWTQPVNPPPGGGFASTWEIFLLPCGSPAPIATSIPTATVTTNPYVASGLSPLTCYDFYVRAQCSATDTSPVTAVKTFNTPDINNECTGSKLAPVNQNTNCLQTVFGSLAAATGSPQTNIGTGCSATSDDDDVWFHFVATATTHYVSIQGINYGTLPTGLNFAVYSGTCGAITQFGACFTTTSSSVLNGLTIGQTYFIKVYSAGTTPVTTQFELCIGTKAIVCNTSLPLCAITPIILPNNVGVPTTPNPVSPFSPTSTTVGCLGSAPAPTFYYLQLPANGNYTFFLEQNTNNTFSGTPLDVDFAAWGPYASTTAACGTISTANASATGGFCSFSGSATETVTITGGITGQVYVVMITNFSQRKGFVRLSQTSGPLPSNCCPYTNFSYPGSAFCRDGVNPTASTQFGGTAGVYSSTAGLVIDPVTGLINLAASTVGTYLVKNTIPANGGCTLSESTWTLTISDPANAAISYPTPQTYCSNDTTLKTVTQTGTTGGGYFALPSGLSINTLTGAINPSLSAPGTYTVKYAINSIVGCPTFTAITNVVITKLPIATFNYGTLPYCQNGGNATPTFTGGGVAGVFTSSTGLVINATTGVIDLATSTPGTYTVTNTIPAAGGCADVIATNTINITTLPVATFNYAGSPYCQNGTNPSPTFTGAGAAGTFASTTGLVINSTTGIVDLALSTAGTYTVTNTIPAGNGCPIVVSTATITINPNPLAIIVSSDADNTICSNQTATLTVTPSNFIASAASYAWTLNGVTIAGTTNVISPTATGIYGVTISLNGCTNVLPLTMMFTVNALPTYTLTGTNIVKCVNETAVLTVNPTNYTLGATGITYSWTLDGVPVTPTNTTNTLSSNQYGLYEVSVGNFGCITKRTITVGLDTANIPINTVGECVGPNYIIKASPISGSFLPTATDVTYEWKNDSGSVVGTNQNSFNVTEYVANGGFSIFPQTFTVKITTIPDGCTDDQSFVVESPICTIQKGLSPNGDGKNDFLDLRGLGVKQLTIFNRYGTKIFSQENYTNEWRGQNSKSENSPVGTYYYVIELKTGENKTGWIYINR
jgi:gliding motility-associated-like protein